jgi:AcrR family transcriptional regulator
MHCNQLQAEVMKTGSGSSRTDGKSPARSIRPVRHRRPQRRSSETQQKLIDAAIQLLQESGFSRLTLTDVARRAGLTSGAIQHHFSSRRALIRSVVESLYPVLHIVVDHVAAADRSVPDRINRLIDVYWSIYGRSEYLVFWELVFGTRQLPELRDYLRSLQKELVAGAVADIVRLFPDIGMRPRRAKQLFVFITCQLRGLALLSLFEEAQALDTDVILLKTATQQLIAGDW